MVIFFIPGGITFHQSLSIYKFVSYGDRSAIACKQAHHYITRVKERVGKHGEQSRRVGSQPARKSLASRRLALLAESLAHVTQCAMAAWKELCTSTFVSITTAISKPYRIQTPSLARYIKFKSNEFCAFIFRPVVVWLFKPKTCLHVIMARIKCILNNVQHRQRLLSFDVFSNRKKHCLAAVIEYYLL